ncbi:MAG TPA: S-methyl-5'-thioadenosine phosphorylase [Acidimicrobiales bacterium]
MAAPGAGAELGVFGGSGFYSFLDDVDTVEVATPYGPPSAPVVVGTVGDRRVAFLPRHGTKHELPPHRIPYRANLWALRSLGVRRVLGPCAAGSLQPDVAPGSFVVCDQLVDRTWGRDDTYFDGPTVNHVSFAEPYCPELRRVAVDAGRAEGITVHDGGTVVVVQGPRFSTKAESRWYRSAGWEVINMTQYPEAYLARELGMCYAAIALVTDYDTGLEDDPSIEPVSHEQVFRFLHDNVDRVRRLLFRALPAVPADRSCACADAPNGIDPDPPAG